MEAGLEKLSKEELIEVNNSLIKAVQDNQRELIFTRINFLFKVLEYKENFTSDFVIEAVEELEKLLRKPDEFREGDKAAEGQEV